MATIFRYGSTAATPRSDRLARDLPFVVARESADDRVTRTRPSEVAHGGQLTGELKSIIELLPLVGMSWPPVGTCERPVLTMKVYDLTLGRWIPVRPNAAPRRAAHDARVIASMAGML